MKTENETPNHDEWRELPCHSLKDPGERTFFRYYGYLTDANTSMHVFNPISSQVELAYICSSRVSGFKVRQYMVQRNDVADTYNYAVSAVVYSDTLTSTMDHVLAHGLAKEEAEILCRQIAQKTGRLIEMSPEILNLNAKVVNIKEDG